MSPKRAAQFELYRDQNGKWHWRLLAGNSMPIAVSSKGYPSRQACILALRLVADAARDCPIWNRELEVWEYG
ncbi:YegP family protein [Stenotrophomonas geniculata]|uniref:YegP family protein n=1 Tax=Stenotrophomonas TaxID=40323 RepID=UPI0009BEA08C